LIEQQSPSSSLTILIGLGDIKALGELSLVSFFADLRHDDITSSSAQTDRAAFPRSRGRSFAALSHRRDF